MRLDVSQRIAPLQNNAVIQRAIDTAYNLKSVLLQRQRPLCLSTDLLLSILTASRFRRRTPVRSSSSLRLPATRRPSSRLSPTLSSSSSASYRYVPSFISMHQKAASPRMAEEEARRFLIEGRSPPPYARQGEHLQGVLRPVGRRHRGQAGRRQGQGGHRLHPGPSSPSPPLSRLFPLRLAEADETVSSFTENRTRCSLCLTRPSRS